LEVQAHPAALLVQLRVDAAVGSPAITENVKVFAPVFVIVFAPETFVPPLTVTEAPEAMPCAFDVTVQTQGWVPSDV
jgi:hypothetical protein